MGAAPAGPACGEFHRTSSLHAAAARAGECAVTCRRLIGVLAAVLVVVAAAAMVTPAAAQLYPTRPVRLVVGFPAGSTSDIIARIYADKLTEYFNQRFIVENSPGDASNDAAAAVARAEPDGYTLFLASNAQSAAVTLLGRRCAFPQRFDPIALLGIVPSVLVVSQSLGVSSVDELVALAKSRPGTIAYGSAGPGTGPQLAAELFNGAAGVRLIEAPYTGTHDAAADLVAGRLPVLFAPLPAVAGFLADPRIKPLAVVGAKRTALAPYLPTLKEAGVAGADVNLWYGLMAPRGTPLEIEREIANAVATALDNRMFRDTLVGSGAEPVRASLDTFAAFIELDIPRWAKAIGATGLATQ